MTTIKSTAANSAQNLPAVEPRPYVRKSIAIHLTETDVKKALASYVAKKTEHNVQGYEMNCTISQPHSDMQEYYLSFSWDVGTLHHVPPESFAHLYNSDAAVRSTVNFAIAVAATIATALFAALAIVGATAALDSPTNSYAAMAASMAQLCAGTLGALASGFAATSSISAVLRSAFWRRGRMAENINGKATT